MRKPVVAIAAALLILTGACGDDAPETDEPTGPSAVLRDGLSEIDSGRIALSLITTKSGLPDRGFEMAGAFAASASPEALPVAELTYKIHLPTRTQESGFVSDGTRAWVITHRGTTELEGEGLESLKGGEDVSGIRQLQLAEWFSGDLTEEPGELLDGVGTVSYTGEVDATAALNNLMAMTNTLGANVPEPLDDAGLERVRAAVRSATAIIVAGAQDELIRKVAFTIEFAPDREDLGDLLAQLEGDRTVFELTLTHVNKPVTPPAPPAGAPAPPLTTSSTEASVPQA